MSEGEIGFKGVHGGWLGCDEYGILGARREARGLEENFTIESSIPSDDTHNISNTSSRQRSGFRFKTAASKKDENRYLSATTQFNKPKNQTKIKDDPENSDSDTTRSKQKKVSISLRGDGTLPSPKTRDVNPTSTSDQDEEDKDEDQIDTTLLILRMQARFLPKTHQQQSDARSKEKISRRELEAAVGRRLEDEEVKRLKRAKRNGDFYEEVLDFRAKGKHDKFA